MDVNYISSGNIIKSLSDIVETQFDYDQSNNFIKFSNGVMIAFGSYNIDTLMGDLNWKSPYTVTIKYPVSFNYIPRIFISNNTSRIDFTHDGTHYESYEFPMRTLTSTKSEFGVEYMLPLAYEILKKDGKDTSISYAVTNSSWMAIGTWK